MTAELERFTTDNGLRVVLAPDPTNPVVAVAVHYDVGFRSEPEGRTGFAHLFEHLMFQGSESMEKFASIRHITGSGGGTYNGSTHPDYTDYYEVLPSAALERALFYEADRMRAPTITPETLANQIDVVKEEIRLNVLNRPYGGFPWIWLPQVLYDTFPNAHNGYGDFVDLDRATLDDCAEFFDMYYAPSNAVLTLGGDFTPERARELIEQHFGDVPARPRPPRPSFGEPRPNGEKRGSRLDPHAPLPALGVGYRVPDPVDELDEYVANVVLASLLADGDGSRLQRRLVHTDALVTDVNAGVGLFGSFEARDPDLLSIAAVHPAEVSERQVLDAIDDELDKLAGTPPDPEELAQITARWTANLHTEHDQLSARTVDLGVFELLYGDPGLLYELPERIGRVSPEDVSAAAKALRPDSRAVLVVDPQEGRERRFHDVQRRESAIHGTTPPADKPRPVSGVLKHRSAAEIGRTARGPRPIPALGEQRTAADLVSAETVLDNGLRVMAVRLANVPTVEVRLRIPFGGSDPLHSAQASVLAETLLSGTARRDRVAVDTELARIGGELVPNLDPERLVVAGSSLASGLPLLFDVLADALTGATYADAEVARERERLVERIEVARTEPSVIAREALQQRRYANHPVTRETPQVADLAGVGLDEVRALHAAGVRPRGSTLILVGDVDPDTVIGDVQRAVGGWADAEARTVPELPAVTGGDLLLVPRAGSLQSQIRLTAQALARSDERYPAMQLANLAFGGYFSSRLVENIREDKGYTYGAVSGFDIIGANATLDVEADTAGEVTAAALLETRYELTRMALLPPTQEELDSARRYTVGSGLISLSTQSGLAGLLTILAGEGLGLQWLVGHPERLKAVTRGQVAEVAREFFAPARFNGVVVGDPDVIGDDLAVLGGVELG